MKSTILFESPDTLRVEFGSAATDRCLQDRMEQLVGVESVALGRYFAWVTVAPHILPLADVARALATLLAEYGDAYADVHLIGDLARHHG